MPIVFYISAAIAILATVMMLTRLNAVHGLLYLVVSLLAVAIIFFTLGAPFAAALEVIIYAGAIMVLFVFIVMLLNLGPPALQAEKARLHASSWIGPAILGMVLMAELAYLFVTAAGPAPLAEIGPAEVGIVLFGPYVLGVEMASMLLLAGLVGAYHLGRRPHREAERE